jgi:hypothetical protein
VIDTAISLLDKLMSLVSERRKNKTTYFSNGIEPIYRDAEQVAADYMALLHELLDRIARGERREDLARFLEERRLRLLPLRMKMRAILRHSDRRRDIEESMDMFQRGVWGLMKGGLGFVEEGYADVPEYGWRDHTILDLLYRLSDEQQGRSTYHSYERAVRKQEECIQRAWQDVVDGYAEIRRKLL